MYICVTEVDAVTKIPCTVEPQRNGPSMPDIKGLDIKWADESTWPIEQNQAGVYLRAPKYYGTCDDDVSILIPGVLEVLTEVEWLERKRLEFIARKPFPSWVEIVTNGVIEWIPPKPRPHDAVLNGGTVMYKWNEKLQEWCVMPPLPSDSYAKGGTKTYMWDKINFCWKLV